MLVDNGVVKALNIEAPGKFEVSDAETMLKQLVSGVSRGQGPEGVRSGESTQAANRAATLKVDRRPRRVRVTAAPRRR